MKRFLVILSLLVMSMALAQTPAISVMKQTASGYSVAIQSATLAQDGFIVVHAYDNNGDLVLTPPLGVTYLQAGTHENVMIDLNPALLAKYGYGMGEKNVLPMVHIDANANEIYEFPDGPDTPVMVDGNMVVADLGLSLAPALNVFAQTPVNNSITLNAVTLEQDGFVVVHAFDTNGDLVLTPPLGVTYLKAGVHPFVKVALDPELLNQYAYTDTKDVLPMIHVDANANEVYEFPDGPDTPVMVNDEMVTANLTIMQPGMETPMVDTGMGVRLEVDGMGRFVSLPSVTLSQPGFVVLHTADANGDLVVLPVLAVSDYLEAGTHENVVIHLPEDASTVVGDMVFAMPHYDDGNMMYDFPDSDPPVMVDGAIYAVGFELQ